MVRNGGRQKRPLFSRLGEIERIPAEDRPS